MKKFRVRIEHDDDASNPRKEFDHVGTMVCWHHRYELGDEQPSEEAHDYLDGLANQIGNYADISDRCDKLADYFWDRAKWVYRVAKIKMAAREKALEDGYVILPLYLYDHSGITMSTGPFSCPWDSGQVGFIYVDLPTTLKELVPDGYKGWDDVVPPNGDHRPTPMTVREITEEYLKGEVKEYDQYLTGDVWGYIVESFDPDDHDPDDAEEAEEDDDNWNHEDSCWGFFGHKYCEEEAESIKRSLEKKEAEYQEEVVPLLAACEI